MAKRWPEFALQKQLFFSTQLGKVKALKSVNGASTTCQEVFNISDKEPRVGKCLT